jgi:hypothetical protein
MRLPILWLFLIAAVPLGEIQVASAQSPTSYPWCARFRSIGATSCYFTSYQQCMTTLSGIGGYCYPSPSRCGADHCAAGRAEFPTGAPAPPPAYLTRLAAVRQ